MACSNTQYGCCPDNITQKNDEEGSNCPVGGCAGTQYGCCDDNLTPKYDQQGTNCNINGGCEGTIYGCCPDQFTPKLDSQGSNCYNNSMGGCAGTRYGCCPDQLTPKQDDQGSNCPSQPPNIIGVCADTKFGCCPYSDIPRSDLVGSNCIVSPVKDINIININSNCNTSTYGCCPDNITAKIDANGSNCPPIGGCASTIYGCCPDNKTPKTDSSGNNCNQQYNYDKILINPKIIIVIIVILIIYICYITFSPEKTGSNGEIMSSNNSQIILFLVILLIIQICIVGLYYFYNINIYSKIKSFFVKSTSSPTTIPPLSSNTNKNSPPVPEITLAPQVFNIPQNVYNYTEANALCQAYGSRLANYQEVEDAYKKGGEWCNYGWSDGQMILFPTQQSTYDQLQKIEGHEHDCGRPGVNGGYIEDDKKRFGVNCYGYKPKITTEEQELMANTTPYPLTKKDILFEKEVEFWKKQIKNILVSPFNYNTWSRI
jgi:hypothetical protein